MTSTRPSGRSYSPGGETSYGSADIGRTYRRLGVVQTRYDGRVEDRDTLADRLTRVVEQGLKVGVGRQTKARDTLVSSVDNEERSVRKRYRYVS